MKKVIVGALAGVALVGIAVVAQGAKDDASTIASVVDIMTAEELTGPPKPNPVNGPAELTKEQVERIVEELKDPAANGGIVKIAFRNEASPGQVRLIQRKIKKRLQELAPPVDLNP